MRQVTLKSGGLFLTASFIVADDLGAGRLVPLLPEFRPLEFAINAIYPHRRHLSAQVRCFVDLLADRFIEHQRCMNPSTPEG
ncbi:MAG: LysR substrate-binding domain-containing protein [Thiohalocapsa sp.]